MEKLSEKELENLVNSQKKQLQRYETRLKDVVAAYKGLLKEKEALEASLAAVTKPNKEEKETVSNENPTSTSQIQNNEKNEDPENPQVQIATLMNSLATLSAEKSRMEASFQADKKQLRYELASKDAIIRDMKEKFNKQITKSSNDLENMKSKLIVERHERDQERNDHKIMVRELQKLLSDERHLKENLDTQLNDLKINFSQTNLTDKTIRELSQELDSCRKRMKQMEANSGKQDQSSQILQQLQSEMANLKQQHSVAIKNEQILGEERSKMLAAQHEERVANLESRLAELSNTVGTYDRLRQQDQEAIIKLKEKIAQMSINQSQKTEQRVMNLNMIIDDILRLKKMLIAENNRQENPIDISKIFALNMIANDNTNEPSSKPSVPLLEDYRKLEIEYEKCLKVNESMKNSLDIQGSHIKTLQDKIKVLNRDIDHAEVEYKNKIIEHNSILRNEKAKYREIISSMEMDFRSKISQLEQQLQKQRDRSLMLLDEKENEIKTLKTSFEIFIPGHLTQHSRSGHDAADEEEHSEGEIHKKKLSHLNAVLNPNSKSGTGNTESYHMLHYAHELARKDVEISGLRKAKHETETALRQALQDKVMAQEELHDKIEALEEQVDRLERCKSREGANLEYLKNVILSFLGSSDNESKKHMLNAIGAVLKFNPTEITTINSYLNKK